VRRPLPASVRFERCVRPRGLHLRDEWDGMLGRGVHAVHEVPEQSTPSARATATARRAGRATRPPEGLPRRRTPPSRGPRWLATRRLRYSTDPQEQGALEGRQPPQMRVPNPAEPPSRRRPAVMAAGAARSGRGARTAVARGLSPWPRAYSSRSGDARPASWAPAPVAGRASFSRCADTRSLDIIEAKGSALHPMPLGWR
jgi:hypothetical protein